jgi:hypothetical protein
VRSQMQRLLYVRDIFLGNLSNRAYTVYRADCMATSVEVERGNISFVQFTTNTWCLSDCQYFVLASLLMRAWGIQYSPGDSASQLKANSRTQPRA